MAFKLNTYEDLSLPDFRINYSLTTSANGTTLSESELLKLMGEELDKVEPSKKVVDALEGLL